MNLRMGGRSGSLTRTFVLVALLTLTAALGLSVATTASAGTNTYPAVWANAPMDSTFDNWGEYNRECTSYAAWMLSSVNGFTMPFHDNASGWKADAQARGYTVDSAPAVGAIGWRMSSSSVGHVVWVEAVNGNGTVTVEDYNSDYSGHYGEHIVSTGTYQYIHFKDVAATGGGPAAPPDADGDGVPDADDLAPTIFGPAGNRGVPDYSAKVTGDFNRDGKADIGVFYDYGNDTTSLFVFTATSGGFSAPTSVWSSGAGNWAWSHIKPVAGDLNGDGTDDIGVFYDYGSDTTGLLNFAGNGDGTFVAPVTVWSSGSGNWDWSRTKAVVGDFGGDGRDDIAVFYDYGNDTTSLFVFTATSGGFSAPTSVWSSGAGNWAWSHIKPAAGDLNGDGRADIEVMYDYGGASTAVLDFTATGTGFTAPVTVWSSGAGNWDWSRSDQWVGDFDGDGNADIEAMYDYGSSATSLFVLAGRGDGTFAAPVPAWNSGWGNWSWSNSKTLSGDFDGDGKDDVGVFYDYGSSTTSLFSFPGSSSGSTTPAPVWSSGPGNWAWSRVLLA